eukprot:3804103-Alexandrium_andersonii.AAC.1
MSASLVGSEMCIRDRAWRASPGLGLRNSAPKARAHAQGRRAPARLRSPCLLYTSDAADDM